AGHLERVATRDGVVAVERRRDDLRRAGHGLEVDAPAIHAVDGDAKGCAGVLDVDDLEALLAEKGLDQSADALACRHLSHLPSRATPSTKNVGKRPRSTTTRPHPLPHQSNGTAGEV